MYENIKIFNLISIEIRIDVNPFFGGSGIGFKGLLPGDKMVNRYYISIEKKLLYLLFTPIIPPTAPAITAPTIIIIDFKFNEKSPSITLDNI